ncbi:hypothetical protein Tco_1336947 [Tanacetum coccineum]
MCDRCFPEDRTVEKYFGGLPDMIHGSVMATKPKTMQDAIEFATELIDKKISTFAERQAENKRILDNNNQAQQQLPKRQNVVQAYAVGTGERKRYAGHFHCATSASFITMARALEPSLAMNLRLKALLKVGPFKVLEQVESVAYKLKLPQELSRVHNTFHVSNLRKCYADEPLAVPLGGLHLDNEL